METNKRPTQPRDWKKKIQVEGTDLTLPSGNIALVKQMSPQAFMQSGLIPDPLTAIIRKSIGEKQGLPPTAMAEISEDPEMLMSAMELFDRVLVYVVAEPFVKMPPTCDHLTGEVRCEMYYNTAVHRDNKDPEYHEYHEGARADDILYADQVDMDDKMFIFNWCLGGTRDLDQFRKELQGNVDAVSDSQNIQPEA